MLLFLSFVSCIQILDLNNFKKSDFKTYLHIKIDILIIKKSFEQQKIGTLVKPNFTACKTPWTNLVVKVYLILVFLFLITAIPEEIK